jgi:hypothetical protein
MSEPRDDAFEKLVAQLDYPVTPSTSSDTAAGTRAPLTSRSSTTQLPGSSAGSRSGSLSAITLGIYWSP